MYEDLIAHLKQESRVFIRGKKRAVHKECPVSLSGQNIGEKYYFGEAYDLKEQDGRYNLDFITSYSQSRLLDTLSYTRLEFLLGKKSFMGYFTIANRCPINNQLEDLELILHTIQE